MYNNHSTVFDLKRKTVSDLTYFMTRLTCTDLKSDYTEFEYSPMKPFCSIKYLDNYYSVCVLPYTLKKKNQLLLTCLPFCNIFWFECCDN